MQYPREYPPDFVEEAEKAWGSGNPAFLIKLYAGRYEVGTLLRDAAEVPFTAKELVEAHESGGLDSLLERARRQVRLGEIFQKWIDITQPPRASPSGGY